LLAEQKNDSTATEPKKEAVKEAKNSGLQNLVLIIVFVAVFAAAFIYFQSTRTSEKQYDFQGIRVLCVGCTGDAQTALHAALAKPKVLIREELVSGNSTKNTVVAIAAAQIARNFQALNKTMYAFGVVDGRPEIECNKYTDNCTGESIQVAVGECNCMRIDATAGNGGIVRVEGTEEWYSENGYARVLTIASVIGGAVT